MKALNKAENANNRNIIWVLSFYFFLWVFNKPEMNGLGAETIRLFLSQYQSRYL